jgi:HEAT repeats
MNVDSKDILREEIQRFRVWADSQPVETRSGEWEMDYDDWGRLYRAVESTLKTSSSEWDAEIRGWLIYAIARDNEVEILAGRLAELQIYDLIPDLLKSDEWHAKWQLAKQLGKHSFTPECETALVALAHDADEYVRRRALMVLAEHNSDHTERLALAAWDSGDEYQRMASLYSLNMIHSPALPKYLELAQEDGRAYLLNQAAEIAGTE